MNIVYCKNEESEYFGKIDLARFGDQDTRASGNNERGERSEEELTHLL